MLFVPLGRAKNQWMQHFTPSIWLSSRQADPFSRLLSFVEVEPCFVNLVSSVKVRTGIGSPSLYHLHFSGLPTATTASSFPTTILMSAIIWSNIPLMIMRMRISLHIMALGKHSFSCWPRLVDQMGSLNSAREPPDYVFRPVASATYSKASQMP